jgi:hypothetical protein
MNSILSKYKTLFILFAYLIAATALYTSLTGNNPMPFLMGLFFITFSFFKVIHLSKFQDSFSQYDLLAKTMPHYARYYPFIEIVLGILFLCNWLPLLASIITIIILVSTNIGVLIALKKGQIMECACLGVVFKLPLSRVTVFENTVMILMAVVQVWMLV